ncbi:hypothetical protein [Orenia marismortui]|uniref:hypothetical protein n=1 Tax=Orenia marismortui TaxID=46469 RepID=UPI00036450B9|nr:hypothetical protein [Orenia marismortui]
MDKKEIETIKQLEREVIEILREGYESTREDVLEMTDNIKSAKEMDESETQLILDSYKNTVTLLLDSLNSTINIAEKLSVRD